MPRKAIPTWFVASVVVRRGDRFLLVQERKRGSPWALPGGRVEEGESLVDAAVRETLEESGVAVRLTGIVRLEHAPRGRRARIRAVFLGEPVDETRPKSVADDESLGAEWIALDEIGRIPLRDPEIETLLRYVASGGPIYPLAVLAERGAPYTLAVAEPNDGGFDEPPSRRRDSAVFRAARWLRATLGGE